ncbi:DUF4126 family protein [Methylocella silvestris]|uniref:DUF4126 domain-containing protein n=1 Tax=Methylocella silvestris TaxID=199596 RepID=A0A2J7TI46_METSI|nr:DUF4126 family protein [Methylocella silvestris]PNG26419.1 DUF4126 domain-containing protein [Methylocella silvestris]
MSLYLLAFLIGVVAGLRSFLPLAATSLAAHAGLLSLQGGPLAFLGNAVIAYILAGLALAELVADKLPQIPSRKTPGPFVFRIVSGAVCGAAIGAEGGALIGGLIAGALGAAAGTLGGAEARARLARAFGRDLPAALLEDAVAILIAVLVVKSA